MVSGGGDRRLTPEAVAWFRTGRRAGLRGLDAALRPRHGPEYALSKLATWPKSLHTTTTATTRYGTAIATSWNRLHPRLTHRGYWADHVGELPVIAGRNGTPRRCSSSE